MDTEFNELNEKPLFTYQRKDGDACVYNIAMFKSYKGPHGMYEDVGTYEVIDASEVESLSEKKVSNVVKLLCGKTTLENLSDQVDTRLLYELKPRANEIDPTTICFRTYDGDGVSEENAVLTLQKGVLNERRV